MIAGVVVLAGLMAAAWLWHRSANRSLDQHVDQALRLGNERRWGACDCGQPLRPGVVHGVRMCAPSREMLP